MSRKTEYVLKGVHLVDDTAEEWRPIPGYEGYYSASSLGRIRSEARVIDRPGPKGVLTLRERIIAQCTHRRSGYVITSLNRDNRRRAFQVHVLVMRAFAGPRPDDKVIRHLDGDQNNNTLANLEYGTASENQLDSVRHGTHSFANRTHCPREHELVEPNLVACLAKKGYRDCLSCNRARTTARNRLQRNQIVIDWIELSHLNYAEIMGKTDMRAA